MQASAGAVRHAVTYHRLLFAAKTALAAGLAWYLAPLMPGPAAAYPYYAPLGALVSMYPTVADSARHGLQSLLGLALGIGVAFVFTTFTGPTALAIAAVVGIAVLIGGLPRMGAASDWVPMAALFVLVIGGANAESFSFAYILQMAAGVAVGFAVNWLVFPPLHLDGVDRSSAAHRKALARQLKDMAAAMQESWPPDHEDWAGRSQELARTASEVRAAVHDAEVSAKANPRSRRHHRALEHNLAEQRYIERVTFHVQDVTDVLASAIWEEHADTVIPAEITGDLSAALSSVAGLLSDWNDPDALAGSLAEARDAVGQLSSAVARAASRDANVTAGASVAMSLRRIISVVAGKADDGRRD
ncbi:hypothetical protein BIU82_04620 [Arthrobacter sp. SW1]|nr:hypothetical protein BIU82_04620 [Arthrobacter sp. SW1]